MEYINTDLKPHSKQTKKFITKFFNFIKEEEKKNNIILLYRGDKIKNIMKRLSKEKPEDTNILLYNLLFSVGDKARILLIEKKFSSTSEHLIDIGETTETTTRFIFNKINDVIRKHTTSLPKTFIDFFSDAHNINVFTDCITSSYESIKIRDYYLYLLHVAGSVGLRKGTPLISSSCNKKTAIDFARQSNKDGIILHYFFHRPFDKYLIAPWLISPHHEAVERISLPTYNPYGLYKNQYEVAIKGALFPHFLIGLELLGYDKMIINPAIINIDSAGFSLILEHGLPIDQSDFDNKINSTSFKAYIEMDTNGNISQKTLTD